MQLAHRKICGGDGGGQLDFLPMGAAASGEIGPDRCGARRSRSTSLTSESKMMTSSRRVRFSTTALQYKRAAVKAVALNRAAATLPHMSGPWSSSFMAETAAC